MCSLTVRSVGLKQLLLIVFAIGYTNAVDLSGVSIKMNENMAKRKSRKTRPLELDYPSHSQTLERQRLSVKPLVIGRRDGLFRQKLKSRMIMKKFNA